MAVRANRDFYFLRLGLNVDVGVVLIPLTTAAPGNIARPSVDLELRGHETSLAAFVF